MCYLEKHREDNEWLGAILEEKKMNLKKDIVKLNIDLVKMTKTIEYLEELLVNQELSSDEFGEIYNQKSSLIHVKKKYEMLLNELRQDKK